MLIRIALCAGLAGAAGLAPVRSQERSLDRLVPSPCLVYVSLDVPALLDGLSRTPLRDAWDESGLADDWTRAMRMATEALGEEMTESEFEPSDFEWMLGGEVAFAVGAFTGERDEQERFRLPPMLFLADAGDRADELERFMDKWVDELRDGDEPVTEEDYRGTTLYLVEPDYDDEDLDGPVAPPGEICFARVGSTFVTATDAEAARGVVRAAGGDGEAQALAADANYRTIRERTGHPESMSFYVDVENLHDAIRVALDDDDVRGIFDDVVSVLGFKTLRGLGGGYSVRPDGLWSEMFALNPGEQSGVIWDLGGVSAPVTPPTFLPADVDSFQTMHADFTRLWSDIERMVDIFVKLEPGTPEDPLGMAEEMLGFAPGDVFRSLEGEVTIYSRAPAEAPAPSGPDMGMMGLGFQGMDMVIRLRESVTLANALDKLEELANAEGPGGWPFEEEEYLGRIVHQLRPELAEGMPIKPCFTVTQNVLAFAMTRDNLDAVIRRLDSTEGGLAESESYRRAAEHFPANAGYVSYTSTGAVKKAVDQMEQMLGMVTQMGMGDEEGAEWLELAVEMVPKLRDMLDVLDVAVGYSQPSSEGWHLTSGWLFAEED